MHLNYKQIICHINGLYTTTKSETILLILCQLVRSTDTLQSSPITDGTDESMSTTHPVFVESFSHEMTQKKQQQHRGNSKPFISQSEKNVIKAINRFEV